MRDRLETSFVVFALLFFSNAALDLVQKSQQDPSDFVATASDPVRSAVALSIYFVLLALGLLNYNAIIAALRRSKLLLSLIVLSMVSVSWSPNPAVTATRAVLLLATTLFGIYFAVRFEPFEQLRLLSLTMAILMGASIVLALGFPAYGTQADMGGAWCGVFPQKNNLGRMAVLSVIVFLFMGKQARSRRWFWNVAAILALGAVVLSRSATAVAVVLALSASFVAFSLFRLPVRLRIPAVCLSLALATGTVVVATSNIDFLLASLGRDATLSGRMELWSALMGSVSKHLWFGYGYGGYWLGPGSESDTVVDQIHWAAMHAHNGLLDLTLQLGVVGVMIFVLLFLMCVIRAVRLARTQTS
jgi:O-antigen ligase